MREVKGRSGSKFRCELLDTCKSTSSDADKPLENVQPDVHEIVKDNARINIAERTQMGNVANCICILRVCRLTLNIC